MRLLFVVRALFRVWRAWRSDQVWLKVLSDECQRLGGVYVKFLQHLASTELMAQVYAASGYRLDAFDDVAVESIDVAEVLRQELGSKASQIVVDGDQPFATGSFAQVYRCRVADRPGSRYIIKILRPSVVRYLNFDLAVLRFCCWAGQFMLKNDIFPLVEIADEFIKTTKRETDYQRELITAQAIREYFARRTDNVVVPETLADYSTRRILVQDYIDGLPLTEVVERAQAGRDTYQFVKDQLGSDMQQQLVTVGSEFLIAILQADIIMADPHPGNIYLLRDNKIALIDFGLAVAAPQHRASFYHMIVQYRALYEDRADMGLLALAMLAFYDHTLYQALDVIAKDRSLTRTIYEYANTLLQSTTSMFAANRQITQLFLNEINAGNRFAVRLDSVDIMLQRGLYHYLAAARLACGDEYRRTHYWRIVHDALELAEVHANIYGISEAVRSSPMSIELAQEIVMDWMSKVAERDRAAYAMLLQKGELS